MWGPDSLSLGIGLVIAVVVSVQVGSVVASDSFDRDMSEAREWCDAQGGDLHMSNALAHGGLHCALPSGELVHVPEDPAETAAAADGTATMTPAPVPDGPEPATPRPTAQRSNMDERWAIAAASSATATGTEVAG